MSKELLKDASSYVDPNGFVFWHNQEPYRYIYPDMKNFYLSLIEEGLFEKLHKEYNFINFDIASLPDGENLDPHGLILQPEKMDPISYPVEWCPSMLKKAALNTIEINQELIKSNLMLQDAYPWNITFNGTEPVFVDVTSVVKESPMLIWPAYEQFESFFVRPLSLMQYGLGKIARQSYLNQIDGIALPDYYKLLPFIKKLSSPNIVFSNFLNKKIQSNPNIKRKINNFVKKLNVLPCNTEIRTRFFQSLHNKVSAFKNPGYKDVWENYYKEIPQEWDKNFKVEEIKNLLAKTKPSTVVDVGCNTGIFSSIAAEHKAKVISVDSSESCIESLYHHAETKKLNILPLISDALSPTPGFGFMGQQFKPLWDRVKGDLVFCLGLMHHLHIAGRQPIENIAKLFFHITNKWVIFEYISKEDENNNLIESIRSIEYTFEGTLDILSNYFYIREVLNSDRPTRKLLLLEKIRQL